jgi:hypothetical protein
MEQLEEPGEICPICMEPIEPQDTVVRVMEQAVHTDCYREQTEARDVA